MGGDMLNAMKYISTVPFSGLFNWDVKIILGDNIITSKKHPMKPFSYFTRPANIQKVKIEDEQEYKILGVRSYGLGAYKNRITKGKYLKMKVYQQAKLNHLFWCKVDTKNGAFGIITQELSDGIASSNMMFAELDLSRINPDYLQLLFRCPKINAYMDSMVTGTTNRKYIRFSDLLSNVKVPIPSLEEQNELVEEYNKVIAKADDLVKECQEIDLSILRYFNKIVELKQSTRQVKLLSTMRYADISNRWDPFAVTNGLSADVPIYPLGSFITDIATGTTPPTSKKEYFNGNIKFYTPSDINGRLYLANSERTLTKKAIEDKKARLFHKGDILFVGIGSTIGKVGIVRDEIVSSNQQITGFKLNTDLLYPEYVFYYLHYHKDITTIEQSKTTLPIVNQEKIANIPIPVPTMSQQKEMVGHMNHMREKIDKLYKQSIDCRRKSLKNFETQIFE